MEEPGVDRVIAHIDFWRGLGGLALIAFVGMASIVTGGWAGWLFGIASVLVAAGLLARGVRRRLHA